jgi:hypothetical protein
VRVVGKRAARFRFMIRDRAGQFTDGSDAVLSAVAFGISWMVNVDRLTTGSSSSRRQE